MTQLHTRPRHHIDYRALTLVPPSPAFPGGGVQRVERHGDTGSSITFTLPPPPPRPTLGHGTHVTGPHRYDCDKTLWTLWTLDSGSVSCAPPRCLLVCGCAAPVCQWCGLQVTCHRQPPGGARARDGMTLSTDIANYHRGEGHCGVHRLSAYRKTCHGIQRLTTAKIWK